MEKIEQEESRYTVEPIQHYDIYNFYLKAQAGQWTQDEIKEEMSKDASRWGRLEPKVQHFIKYIVAFFAISDGVVGEIINEELLSRVKVKEAQIWYNHQAMMEDIHGIVYSRFVQEYVQSVQERNTIFHNINSYKSIKSKIQWIHRWSGRASDQIGQISKTEQVPLGQIVLANAIMEGLFFSSSFCAIFWVNHYYKGMLPGLAKGNEWISRDEGMHTDFAIMLYRNHIKHKLSTETVHKMIKEAIAVESQFIQEALPENLKGMNAELMLQYVKFVADGLLADLEYPVLYGVENPFEFMIKQSVGVRMGDFFNDQSGAEYSLGVDDGLDFDDDF